MPEIISIRGFMVAVIGDRATDDGTVEDVVGGRELSAQQANLLDHAGGASGLDKVTGLKRPQD